MAPQIPWEEKREPSSEDKLEAVMFTIIFMILGAVGLMLVFAVVQGLWHVGFINALVIIGIFAGLFAIGKAIYHTILDKDIL